MQINSVSNGAYDMQSSGESVMKKAQQQSQLTAETLKKVMDQNMQAMQSQKQPPANPKGTISIYA